VMRADKILVLEDGRISQMENHRQLMSEDGLYKNIYNIQSQIEDEVEKEVAHVNLPL